MALTAAPHIRDVHPNSPEFQGALAKAGTILAGTQLSVSSRHHHYQMEANEVLFEEPITSDELALYPLFEEKAIENGLPSCWGFESDGTPVVLRYADRRLHELSDLNVTSDQFLAEVSAIGKAFAANGLHEILELHVIRQLFPVGDDKVTLEETDEAKRSQKITAITPSIEMLKVDHPAAAGWIFTGSGEPIPANFCDLQYRYH